MFIAVDCARPVQDTLTTLPEHLPRDLKQKYKFIDAHSLGSGHPRCPSKPKPHCIAFKNPCGGAVARVCRMQELETGRHVAVKAGQSQGIRKISQTCPVQVVEKYPLKIRNMITQMEREIRVHKRLRHPNILHLHACFEEGLKLFQDFESDSMQIPSISGQHPLVHGAGARKSFGEPPASLPLEAASRASGGMALRPGPDPLKASLTWTPKNLPCFGFLFMISLYKSLNRYCRFFGV